MFGDGTLPTDSTAVTVLRDYGVEEAELQSLGEAAVQRCIMSRNPRYVTDPLYSAKLRLSVFQEVTNKWTQIDGTVPWSAADEAGRYFRGPSWRNNSCAVDCIIVIALLLNAGRCAADQCLQEYSRTLTEPTRILLYIISKPWKKLTKKTINALRDIVIKALHSYNSAQFPLKGMKGITDTFYALLAGLPQLSYTVARIYKCRDSIAKIYCQISPQGTTRYTTRSNVSMSSAMMDTLGVQWGEGSEHTVEYLLNRMFHDRELSGGLPPGIPECEREDCPGTVQRDVVLDRLPPVLVLSEDWHHSWMTERFSNLQVRYSTLQYKESITEVDAKYEPLGCVLNVGEHFVLNWALDNSSSKPSFIHYDGMSKQGKFFPIPDLNYRLDDGNSQTSLLFYRLCLEQ